MNSHHCKWLSSFLSPHPLTTEDRVSPVSKHHCPPIHGSLKLTRKCAVCELSRQKWKSFVFLFRCQCIYFYPPGFWWTESVESSSCCSSHEHQDEISLSEMSTILRTPSHWIPEDISASILVFMRLIPSFTFVSYQSFCMMLPPQIKDFMGNVCVYAVITKSSPLIKHCAPI